MWASGILGLGSLICVAFGARVRGMIALLQPVVVIVAFVTSVLLAYTAYEGGKIRHPEAYSDQAGESKE